MAEEDPERPFTCSYCDRKFESYFGLRSHIGLAHVLGPTCDICNETFKNRKSLSRHKYKKHKEEMESKGQTRNSIKCSQCPKFLATALELCTHLKDEHKLEIEIKELNFDKKEEFDAWRKECEMAKQFQFWLKHVERPKKLEDQKMYYYCHRSGCFNSNGKLPKKLSHCCAFAVAHITLEGIKVKACLEHYGHENTRSRGKRVTSDSTNLESTVAPADKNNANEVSTTEVAKTLKIPKPRTVPKKRKLDNNVSNILDSSILPAFNVFAPSTNNNNAYFQNPAPNPSTSTPMMGYSHYFTPADPNAVMQAGNMPQLHPQAQPYHQQQVVPAPRHPTLGTEASVSEIPASSASGCGPGPSSGGSLLSSKSLISDLFKSHSINDPAIAGEIFRKIKEIEQLYDMAKQKEVSSAVPTLTNASPINRNVQPGQVTGKQKRIRNSNTMVSKQKQMALPPDRATSSSSLNHAIMAEIHSDPNITPPGCRRSTRIQSKSCDKPSKMKMKITPARNICAFWTPKK